METALPWLSAADLAGDGSVSRDKAMALLRSSSSLSVDQSDMVTTLNVVVDIYEGSDEKTRSGYLVP